MKIIDVLKKALALISKKSRWCQGHRAEDKDGVVVEPTDREAVRFCALGAIAHIARSKKLSNACEAKLNEASPSLCAWLTNDNHGHAETLKMYRNAIKELRK